jgi:hypothetical protein
MVPLQPGVAGSAGNRATASSVHGAPRTTHKHAHPPSHTLTLGLLDFFLLCPCLACLGSTSSNDHGLPSSLCVVWLSLRWWWWNTPVDAVMVLAAVASIGMAVSAAVCTKWCQKKRARLSSSFGQSTHDGLSSNSELSDPFSSGKYRTNPMYVGTCACSPLPPWLQPCRALSSVGHSPAGRGMPEWVCLCGAKGALNAVPNVDSFLFFGTCAAGGRVWITAWV